MDGVVCAHGARQFEAPRIHVGGDDARRTRRSADAHGECANRATSGNQDDRPRDIGRECGVERIPHRVVDATDVVADRIVEMPDIRGGHGDELGEAPVTIDADDSGGRVRVGIAGPAEERAFIDDVPLGGHAIADFDRLDQAARCDDIAGELMADDERRFAATGGPGVPLVDVHVCPADARAADADQHFVVADRWNGHVRESETAAGRLFHERFHETQGIGGAATGAVGERMTGR